MVFETGEMKLLRYVIPCLIELKMQQTEKVSHTKNERARESVVECEWSDVSITFIDNLKSVSSVIWDESFTRLNRTWEFTDDFQH